MQVHSPVLHLVSPNPHTWDTTAPQRQMNLRQEYVLVPLAAREQALRI